MSSCRNLPKWTEVYPQGTSVGNEEQRFFIALARHPKWQFRSVAAIAKDSGLTLERVEEILQKYYKKGMVLPNPKNEDQWAYWERVPKLVGCSSQTLASKDQKKRVDAAF